jgi:hypothetical protein
VPIPLIVQLPGLGGSVLARNGVPVWDATAAVLAGRAVRPDLLAWEADDLEPIGLIDTMTVIPGLFALPGYDTMIRNLRAWFGARLRVLDYRPGVPIPADVGVLRVPYDFRRSIVDAADTLDRAVAAAGVTAGVAERGMVLLAHSLGGLVGRQWLVTGEHAVHCRALITLGTPHRGAPKALEVLCNGLGVGRFRHWEATRVLRSWPSVYELLPQYPAIWNGTGAIEVTDLPAGCVRGGDSTTGDQFLRRATQAARVHDALATAWSATERPEVIPVYARGHRTLSRAALGGDRLRVTKDDPEWRPNVGWRGDGTVPMASAVPGELGDFPGRWHGVVDKHGPMGGAGGIRHVLVSVMGERLPTRGGELLDRPWLGFDLDDVVWVGDQVPLSVEVLGSTDGPGTGAVATVAGISTPMSWYDGRWHAELPSLSAGVHEVTVETTDVLDETPLWGSAPLVVTDRDQDWTIEAEEPQ